MTRTVLMALLATALLLAACGDDGAEPEAESTAPATTAVETATPTEPPEPEAEPEGDAAETRTYRVRRGDTLSGIAARHNTTVRALVRLNDIDDPNEIRAGQRLQLPPSQ